MIGSKIRKLREQNDMAQIELAYKLGIAPGTLCHIERGTRCPSLDLVVRMCAALKVRPDVMLGEMVDAINDETVA